MFKIELFCEDKNLARVLRSLTSLARGAPTVLPMVNVEEEAKPTVRAETNGSMTAMLSAHIKKNKLSEMTATELRDFAAGSGFSRDSYSYILRQGEKAGLLKRTPHKGLYTVVKEA
jgi:hypothetical protein